MANQPYGEKTPYQKKLLDPRWQKKRLEILSRDNFTCVRCGDPNNTLHVHHRVYKANKEPWDYETNLLVTLCAICHEEEEVFLKFSPKHLSDSFLEAGFFAINFIDIIEALQVIKLQHPPEVVMSAYGYAFSNEKMQAKIIADYFKHLSILQKNRIGKNKNIPGDDSPF